MTGKIILLVFLFVVSSNIYSQSSFSEKFIHSLIFDEVLDKSFVDKEDLVYSNRLGIKYEVEKEKFLIGYDIDNEVKEKLILNEVKYFISEESLDNNFSKIIFTAPEINYSKDFYFLSGKLVNPIKYFTRGWKKLNGKYFQFLVSDERLFNDYCIKKLEDFVDKTSEILRLSNKEKNTLSKEKLLYVFCKNQDEIKSITGYASRGQFILNYDAVVTTYSCHYHEVAHFLINYKLKSLPLYLIPFLQEGFAVAVGGRGGQSAEVLADVGYYLARSGIVDYKNLFEAEGFKNEDATISYPIAGLFSRYLIVKNVDEYLELYRKFSGSPAEINLIKLNMIDKNILANFEEFLKTYKVSEKITFDNRTNSQEIKTEKSFFLTPVNPLEGYRSIKCVELIKDKEYKGEKYYFAINEAEINIYNLYSNELIASHVNSFSKNPAKYFNGKDYEFYISKDLLDEDFNDLKISY
ncbi:MAG: hypothetical protein JSS63_07480 [Bacteroidetes bacterium]|nr:hypothetical protein [Bacteroidota bacterium]